MDKSFLKRMLVTQRANIPLESYLDFISTCIKAGVSAVQFREKNRSVSERMLFVNALFSLLSSQNIPLIINDDPFLCHQIDADGVHLGTNDVDVIRARKLLGSEKIIGLSVNSLIEVEHANHLPINYIGVGAVFFDD